MIYLTGDTHSQFDRLNCFCRSYSTTKEDVMIILGDSGINYYDDSHRIKKTISKFPITIFAIHGNHEQRASNISTYKEIDFFGGKALQEEAYPNIIFAIDGELYYFPDISGDIKKCLVIGGAYSVDKYYRLASGYGWWEDEQPSNEIKIKVETSLNSIDWNIDYIFSHTCPYSLEPREWFLNNINQDSIDSTTELWLDKIMNKITYYRMWYLGHFHGNKYLKEHKMRFMFDDVVCLGEYDSMMSGYAE